MKPVFQTKFTNVETGELGNCIAACLASLLEVGIEDIPYFNPDDSNEVNNRKLDQLLAEHGCYLAGHVWPSKELEGYYLASYEVVKASGYKHCVVCKNGKIVHDPRGDEGVQLKPEPVYLWDIRRNERKD